MQIEKLIHKEIDELAQKSLSHLQAKTPPYEIMSCIDYFRRDLKYYDIISEDLEEQEITHSNKICIDWNSYMQAKDILQFSSSYFGTEYCYVTNKKSGEGMIFIGQVNNIYATQVLFTCLSKIANEIRQNYLQKLKHYKKQSTKEQRVDEYIYEWFEGVMEHLKRGTCFDPWTLYTSSDRQYFVDYVKKNFKTYENIEKLCVVALEVLKPIGELIEGTITLKKFSQIKEEVFKKFPKELSKQRDKEFCSINSKDVVMDFSAEENSDLEDSID
jgi:hypothetical protein